MTSRKYQRRSRNWNTGRLTQPNYQPASDGRKVPWLHPRKMSLAGCMSRCPQAFTGTSSK